MRLTVLMLTSMTLCAQVNSSTQVILAQRGRVNSGTDKQVAFYDGSGTILAGATGLLWNKSTQVFQMNGTGAVGIGSSNTSPTGTLHVYDATAATGVTTQTIRQGAGQASTEILNFLNNAGTALGGWGVNSKPACAVGVRGKVWYVAGGAGVLDTFEICRKDAADVYAWVTLF